MEDLRVGLVSGRHEMPVSEYIFDKIDNVFDFDMMAVKIEDFIMENIGIQRVHTFGINQLDRTEVAVAKGAKRLVLYVTGLTSVTAAVIACCATWGVPLSLMHYDRETDDYVEQVIF